MYASMVEAAQAPWWSSKPVDDEKSSSSFFPSVNSLFGQAAGRKRRYHTEAGSGMMCVVPPGARC